jgi:hypothetical protein
LAPEATVKQELERDTRSSYVTDKFYQARENTVHGRLEQSSMVSIGEKRHPRYGIKTREFERSAMKRTRS